MTTMTLPWRDVALPHRMSGKPGCVFSTSLTKDEAQCLQRLAKDKRVLEIGAAYGYSTCLMANVAKSVVTIDPHSGYGSVEKSFQLFRRHVEALDLQYKITPIVGRSAAIVPQLFEAGLAHKFDLVFIDGDHRYESVEADIGWAWLMSRETIVLHDFGESTCPDVARAIQASFLTDDVYTKNCRVVDTLWIGERR